jgi:hypothetical protein
MDPELYEAYYIKARRKISPLTEWLVSVVLIAAGLLLLDVIV